MSNQISATETIENMAIVLADLYKSGMPIQTVQGIIHKVCMRTFKSHDRHISVYESAYAKFQRAIRTKG